MLENDLTSYDINNFISNNNICKKIWAISIKHKTINSNINTLSYLTQKDKLYYIDCTTGEIVGGQFLI